MMNGDAPLDEAFFRLLADSCPDALFALDPDDERVLLRIVFVNAAGAATYGYEQGELIGRSLIDVLGASLSSEEAGAFVTRLRAGEPAALEVTRHRRNGAEIVVELKARLAERAGRRLVIGVARDVSALRQAQKIEAISRLSGGIAHDFNNLLTVIIGSAELASQEAVSPRVKAPLVEVAEAASRAAALTQQLLAFSRRQALVLKPLRIGRVVERLEPSLRRLVGDGVALVIDIERPLPDIRADAGQLEQVIVNLASNARAAMAHGGTLTLSARRVELTPSSPGKPDDVPAGEYVALSVSDTGEGMTPEVLARVFEPFFTTRAQGEGTGLGLSSVFGIVKQSGGHIAVRSTPGQGSTFEVYFRPESTSTREPSAETRLLDREAGGPKIVLLVEDEDLVRRTAKRVLEGAGHRVLDARSGEEALKLLSSHEGRIDVLLTDVVMPRMGGRELADRVLSERPTVRVLYMSGYTPDLVLHHGVAHGGVAYLQKPFTRASLLAKLGELGA